MGIDRSPGQSTNAVRLLEQTGASFITHEYQSDPDRLSATDVAATLRIPAERLFKTLVTVADTGENLVFIVPGPLSLDLKKAARSAGRKRVMMLPLRELEPLTGYIHGGCSPFAMKKNLPTWMDETALLFETVLVSGGRRGLQVELPPRLLVELTNAQLADLSV
jgi:Cys-tRNA(Pro)/Cys-tRNA(Cys) deacylase